jgi:hypothetical protein
MILLLIINRLNQFAQDYGKLMAFVNYGYYIQQLKENQTNDNVKQNFRTGGSTPMFSNGEMPEQPFPFPYHFENCRHFLTRFGD